MEPRNFIDDITGSLIGLRKEHAKVASHHEDLASGVRELAQELRSIKWTAVGIFAICTLVYCARLGIRYKKKKKPNAKPEAARPLLPATPAEFSYV
ncbi:hypothetical protein L596_025150 [Steinernema carpocapsae]|uniref:Uncharacterized protein n=1 Tax=Steinernema carpocapsae TaxID=34508 RepID=A0A4U5M7T0_STECR|nr:hypothetical protein L596_025150 [Steinernema carpocapsae]